jgi:putative tryptophan/tyrosine transport system substrate-binding protein
MHSMLGENFIWLLSTVLLSTVPASAQQQSNAPKIGFLGAASATVLANRVDALRLGLRELGYEEGKNIVIEYRYSDGKFDRLPNLAADLVSQKVEVVVTGGEAAIRALKQASKTLPIVVGVTGDLVGTGHAASLARPGGNVTGFVDTSPDLSGKRLEILREVLPKASRVAVLWNAGNKVKILDFKETETAAHAFGLRLQSLEVRNPEDFDQRFKAATTQHLPALVVLQDALTISNAKKIVDFANTNHLPAMYGSTEFVDVGGLMSYAANFPDLFRRAATYVDKILKGAKPADLPVEQPTKFEFVINLKAAKQIGLTIPPNVLARADRVIK